MARVASGKKSSGKGTMDKKCPVSTRKRQQAASRSHKEVLDGVCGGAHCPTPSLFQVRPWSLLLSFPICVLPDSGGPLPCPSLSCLRRHCHSDLHRSSPCLWQCPGPRVKAPRCSLFLTLPIQEAKEPSVRYFVWLWFKHDFLPHPVQH